MVRFGVSQLHSRCFLHRLKNLIRDQKVIPLLLTKLYYFQMNAFQKHSPRNLELRSKKFHEILGDAITVLPPDTRHVDYDVIPVIVADGCLYQCGFCRIKSGQQYAPRTKKNITDQIRLLKAFYGRDIQNYNSLFLAEHDALNAGIELIEFAARLAYENFEINQSNLTGSNLFLFGSVDSLMISGMDCFDRLAALPFYTYINIGLESADQQTLALLKKAVSPEGVEKAFDKMIKINKTYDNIEITANFVLDSTLPKNHLFSFYQLINQKLDRFFNKGAIYFSPLMKGTLKKYGEIKNNFYTIKAKSRLPTYLYLIQRL